MSTKPAKVKKKKITAKAKLKNKIIKCVWLNKQRAWCALDNDFTALFSHFQAVFKLVWHRCATYLTLFFHLRHCFCGHSVHVNGEKWRGCLLVPFPFRAARGTCAGSARVKQIITESSTHALPPVWGPARSRSAEVG